MYFFHVLLVQHGCSENTPYDFFKRKLSLVGGDNRGHLHENIAPGAGTFTYFLQPISPSPRLCPGWGGGWGWGFTLTGALLFCLKNKKSWYTIAWQEQDLAAVGRAGHQH